MKRENKKSNLILVILFIMSVIVCERMQIILIPPSKDMIDFQFGLITVSSVFAGFSFTVLGMIMGMISEPLMEKVKDTTIITRKSRELMKSIFCFCISGIISLLFIVGVDSFVESKCPKSNNFVDYFFVLDIALLMIGVVYFIKSTFGVFKVISKIYGIDLEKYEKQRKTYEDAKRKSENHM